MATFTAIRNKKQTAGAMLGVLSYVVQTKKTVLDDACLVTGSNCVPQSSYLEMMTTKQRFRKTDGRQFYHFVQSFSENGWMGDLADSLIQLGKSVERFEDMSPLPTPPTWTDSKQRRREAIKKLAMGQKLSGDQRLEQTM